MSSGYKVARHAPEFLIEAPPIPYGDPILMDKIWKLNIMPKLNHFLWRILSKAIGTTTRLNSRGMNLDPICQRCGLAEETIDHCFFTCPDLICIWRLSNLPFTTPLLTNDSMDNKNRVSAAYSRNTISLVVSTVITLLVTMAYMEKEEFSSL